MIKQEANNQRRVRMKSLDAFNRERMCSHTTTDMNKPIKNGIACPECDAELMDTTPSMTLCSDPPQKNINCSKCKYVGYRIA